MAESGLFCRAVFQFKVTAAAFIRGRHKEHNVEPAAELLEYV
jgi:hypothetical protein